MSDPHPFGFGAFAPGFDFLQNLANSAKATPHSGAGAPGLGGWVSPTLNVEELDKRITELKAVQFWLDQNATALKATIQALEVQKMTLATLKGMNFNVADLAKAFQIKPFEPAVAAPAPAPAPVPEPEPQSTQAQPNAAAPGVIDPLQWWGALTQQFQHIAASAIQETPSSPKAKAPRKAKPAAAAKAAPVRARAPGKKPAP